MNFVLDFLNKEFPELGYVSIAPGIMTKENYACFVEYKYKKYVVDQDGDEAKLFSEYALSHIRNSTFLSERDAMASSLSFGVTKLRIYGYGDFDLLDISDQRSHIQEYGYEQDTSYRDVYVDVFNYVPAYKRWITKKGLATVTVEDAFEFFKEYVHKELPRKEQLMRMAFAHVFTALPMFPDGVKSYHQLREVLSWDNVPELFDADGEEVFVVEEYENMRADDAVGMLYDFACDVIEQMGE